MKKHTTLTAAYESILNESDNLPIGGPSHVTNPVAQAIDRIEQAAKRCAGLVHRGANAYANSQGELKKLPDDLVLTADFLEHVAAMFDEHAG